jgi:hypothetical protein
LEQCLTPRDLLLACLRPFIEHLASSTLSHKTIRRRDDNLWIPDAEVIRDFGYYSETSSPTSSSYRRDALVQQYLRDTIPEDGGALVHNASKEEQRSFDTTHRQLHLFLPQFLSRARLLPTNCPDKALLWGYNYIVCARSS